MPSRQTQAARPNGRSKHAPKCVPAVWFSAIALAVFGACDTPGVTLVDPDISNRNDRGTTIHVTLEDSALAEALGWSQGVPNALVQLHRDVDPFRPDTLYTDSTGHISVTDLLPGYYRVAAYRTSPGEQSDTSTRAFGDGFRTNLPAAIELGMAADRAGSLVVSELFPGGTWPDGIQYDWEGFFELYNNSDTTVYLDGMLWGWALGRGGSALHSCDEQRPFREDPLGLWSLEFHQFPGTGMDYPVAPGQVVTVARDAVDHSVVHPALPDLSQADFELEGTIDPDNPDVPNLPTVGLGYNLLGHGMVTYPSKVYYLAQAIDPTSLETAILPSGSKYARIPTDHIIDVVNGAGVSLDGASTPTPPNKLCRAVNRSFDRLGYAFYRPVSDFRDPLAATWSIQRRVLKLTEGGRPILQDLNTSFLDFIVATRSTGSIEF
ncbi:MAG: DUF4876 domain-containing protein [Gemmatimonadota bacterium]|nr:MAG: DUF4876 domain-containing protein [Gemmatimonadota bacterium]